MINKNILFLSLILSIPVASSASETDPLKKSCELINGVRVDKPAITMIEEDDKCQLFRSSCFRKPPKEITNAYRAAKYLVYVCLRENNKKKWCYLPLDMFRADGLRYKTSHDVVHIHYEKNGKKIIKPFVLDNSFTFAEHHFIQWVKEVDASESGCFCSCF
jgi:hypothetical protein